jgi:hypothetical protein
LFSVLAFIEFAGGILSGRFGLVAPALRLQAPLQLALGLPPMLGMKPLRPALLFVIPELGRAVPYGVYDIAANAGWVNVGMSADTAEFAVSTIRRWWYAIGRVRYPDTKCLTITADGGGSNGSRVRLWKRELQRLSNELDIDITVHHLPPGTSKWNKIEHRLFSFITMNWRGKPLVSYQAIISLIGATTTENGLTVRCEQDQVTYQKGTKVTDEEMAAINIVRDEFHSEWNYTIRPNNRSERAVDS